VADDQGSPEPRHERPVDAGGREGPAGGGDQEGPAGAGGQERPLVGGYLLTLLWYRRHAGRAGVWTPARGYLIAGVVLTVLALAVPLLTMRLHLLGLLWLPLGDVWIRGTLAFLIIAIGLWVLARAERSRVLAVIALVYTGAALLASLYNVENIVFRLGWNPGRSAFAWQLTVLPNVLLPAAILLVAGGGAFLAQRTRRSAV
jgi:hypothetical protein